MKKPSAEIPDKLFFRISEVAKLAGVEPYVLRFWESEFTMLTPEKNQGGWRVYRKKDVERILEIKRLLYEEGFTIEGAKKQLCQRDGDETPDTPASQKDEEGALPLFSGKEKNQVLRLIRTELESILTLLNKR